jgi:hypothetical protein
MEATDEEAYCDIIHKHKCDICRANVPNSHKPTFLVLDICPKCKDSNLDPKIVEAAKCLGIPEEGYPEPEFLNLVPESDGLKTGKWLMKGLEYLQYNLDIYNYFMNNIRDETQTGIVQNAIFNLVLYKGFISL